MSWYSKREGKGEGCSGSAAPPRLPRNRNALLLLLLLLNSARASPLRRWIEHQSWRIRSVSSPCSDCLMSLYSRGEVKEFIVLHILSLWSKYSVPHFNLLSHLVNTVCMGDSNTCAKYGSLVQLTVLLIMFQELHELVEDLTVRNNAF